MSCTKLLNLNFLNLKWHDVRNSKCDLRRHVGKGPHNIVDCLARHEHSRLSKVRNLDVQIVILGEQQNVLGLDVAVHDVVFVQEVQGSEKFTLQYRIVQDRTGQDRTGQVIDRGWYGTNKKRN